MHDVGRVRPQDKKWGDKTKSRRTQNSPPKTHSSTATADNSRRRATKQAPLASPSSPASVDAAFVEVGHVQLSQSMM